MGGCRAGGTPVDLSPMRARPPAGGRTMRPQVMLLIGLVALLCAPALALGGPLARALDHLASQQDPHGGGFAQGAGTERSYTAWAALAVSAAGGRPERWSRGGASLRDALTRPLRGASMGEMERVAVAISAAGLDPRTAAGINIVRRVLMAQGADGAIGRDVSTTGWGILALRASGLGPDSRAVVGARGALERAQRADGGWSTDDGVPRSAPNTTAEAVQALVAAGRDAGASGSLRRARAFLLAAQNPDGGFPAVVGGESTALTTAWVALSIRALDERSSRPPWNRSGGPLAFLKRMQRPDGGVRNSAASRLASTWATSQAALAFAGRPLPLRAGAPAATRRSPAPDGDLLDAVLAAFGLRRDPTGR